MLLDSNNNVIKITKASLNQDLQNVNQITWNFTIQSKIDEMTKIICNDTLLFKLQNSIRIKIGKISFILEFAKSFSSKDWQNALQIEIIKIPFNIRLKKHSN